MKVSDPSTQHIVLTRFLNVSPSVQYLNRRKMFMRDLSEVQKSIILVIRNSSSEYTSFDELVDQFHNPTSIVMLFKALNDLVVKGFLVQVRMAYRGRIQNHYRLLLADIVEPIHNIVDKIVES